jgi:hypothetical protein
MAVAASGDERLLMGYAGHSRGLTMRYESPQEDVTRALLVRCREGKRVMVWKTQAIPADHPGQTARFVWIAAVDVDRPARRYDVFLNGRKHFTITAPVDSVVRSWTLGSEAGPTLAFKGTGIDRFGDLMGYMFLTVPVGEFPRGKPISIKVVAEDAGTDNWFMIFRHGLARKVTWWALPAVVREKDAAHQLIRVQVVHLGEPAGAVIRVGDAERALRLGLGANQADFPIPAVKKSTRLPITVRIGDRVIEQGVVDAKPVRRFTVHLIHHSHVDIGYTHLQEEVERIQWGHLENAMAIAARTSDYPETARFRWNPEVMWAVDSYLRKEGAKKRALREAIRRGSIELGALFGNQLTGLETAAELIELTASARRVSAWCGVPLRAAMISDVPGATWSLVPMLAQAGVRYLSVGTNPGHRIGHVVEAWGDRPFYWVSQSGEEKVLCWIHEKGYAYFHGGLRGGRQKRERFRKKIFRYLSELTARHYPYDLAVLRYAIGADNGPCDPELPDMVRTWNATYETPKLVISSTTEALGALERRYGDRIPAARGDLTPYWEDGAASTAGATMMNRRAAHYLTQAEIVWSLHAREPFPRARYSGAWRNVLLFHEHTWGSWNSISNPEDAFTRQQWETKKRFAVNAIQQAGVLLEAAGVERVDTTRKGLDVFNTLAWDRSAPLFIPARSVPEGRRLVTDAGGHPLAAQSESGHLGGDLVVWLENLPALGAKRIRFEEGEPHVTGSARVKGNRLWTDRFEVEIDPETGAIAVLRDRRTGRNWADTARGPGLNDYLYVAGRDPRGHTRRIKGPVRIEPGAGGPLIASLLVRSGAPGLEELVRVVQLISGNDAIHVINRLDKKKVFDPEGVHVVFPFAVPDPTVRVGLAYGNYRIEADQLDGACKNYFTTQGWVDVSNHEVGVTWCSPSAPLVEIGGIACDPIAVGWKTRAKPSATILSYVMNNYWETNYKAAQEGAHTFSYAIRPHGRFLAVDAARFSAEQAASLLMVPARSDQPLESLVRFEDPAIHVARLRPTGGKNTLLMTLTNVSLRPASIAGKWSNRVDKVWLTDLAGKQRQPYDDAPTIPGNAIRHLLIETK